MEYTIKNINKLLSNKEMNIYEIVKNIYSELEKYDYLNGFVTKIKDQALKKAKELDKLNYDKNNLFFGVPYVAKDLFITKDILTTACSKILEDFIPVYNSKVIDILENKNAILLGKSTTDELGMGGLGLNSATGIVYNPWNKEYISGGSSSGSATLVGTGLIPFALGTDTGDSIRKPASFCGVVGFKPTYGVISRVGVIPYAPSFDTVGFFARNIEDCVLIFQQLLEYDINDFSMKKHKYNTKKLSSNIKGYKVAYIKELYDVLNPELKISYDRILNELKNQGAIIEPVNFDKNLLSSLSAAYFIITCVEAISSQGSLSGICFGKKENGKTWEDSIIKSRTKYLGKIIQFRYVIGEYSSSIKNQDELFIRAKKIRRLVYDKLNKIFNKYDILIGLSTNNPTPKIANCTPNVVTFQEDISEEFLLLANFSGNPSLSLPLGFWKNNNMPYGININAQRFQEEKLFNLALAIENITGLKNLNPKNSKGK